jgi:hypothetical protein
VWGDLNRHDICGQWGAINIDTGGTANPDPADEPINVEILARVFAGRACMFDDQGVSTRGKAITFDNVDACRAWRAYALYGPILDHEPPSVIRRVTDLLRIASGWGDQEGHGNGGQFYVSDSPCERHSAFTRNWKAFITDQRTGG